MKKILNTIGLMSLGIVGLAVLTVGGMFLTQGSAFAFGNRAYSGNDYGCGGEAEWADFDESELKNAERVADRPGNYGVVGLSARFIHDLHRVEPKFKNLGFPFQKGRKVWETEEEFEADESAIVKASMKGYYTKRNPWRLYNINVNSVRCLDFAEGESDIKDPESFKLSKRDVERFKEIRAKHQQRCVLVTVAFTGESLESEITIGGPDERGFLLCWVQIDDNWKLVWFVE
ncbi:MAG: hypothetical protein V3V10_05180 [Planctomycetota bacterium]